MTLGGVDEHSGVGRPEGRALWSEVPLSSEYDKYKTVKTRFWLWHSGKSP